MSARVLRVVACGALLALVGASCSGGDDASTGSDATGSTPIEPVVAEAEFAERPCWDDVAAAPPVTVRCGTLTVAERHDAADGPTVTLPVAVLEPPTEVSPDPVVYLDGGPGGDGVTMAGPLSGTAVARGHTIVVVGQRGTRYAEPSFDCPEVEAVDVDLYDQDLGTPEATDRPAAALAACYERVAEGGPDLSTYDSATAADDVEAARRALGHDRWTLYGISYGTRLALEVLRRHPDGVRAAVLDSAYPPEVDGYATLVPNARRALDELFSACEADAGCASAFPDLAARTAALYDAYEAQPVDTTVPDPDTGDPVTVRWDGDRLLEAAFLALYVPELIPLLPTLVTLAEQRDMAIATTTYLEQTREAAAGQAEGLYPAVECREEYPFTDTEALATAEAEGPDWAVAAAGSQTAECEAWPAPTADESVSAPVVSPVPVLVLAGRFDPITPPAWGRQVADAQPTAWYVEVPDQGHAVSGDDCVDTVIAAFVDDPSVEPDTTCIARIGPPRWVVPGS
jgi:pimeloyl-ACP methyl ester carboxylesterase